MDIKHSFTHRNIPPILAQIWKFFCTAFVNFYWFINYLPNLNAICLRFDDFPIRFFAKSQFLLCSSVFMNFFLQFSLRNDASANARLTTRLNDGTNTTGPFAKLTFSNFDNRNPAGRSNWLWRLAKMNRKPVHLSTTPSTVLPKGVVCMAKMNRSKQLLLLLPMTLFPIASTCVVFVINFVVVTADCRSHMV